ncbi:GPO family capsid scaffolding protein [Dichelobacter nodosus]|uniref:GPO family capsid scaffolding protein n=1 Tax=Dichelobacter nodosus TaxID=870 RepID=UPI001910BBC5|nr:GPO family capsid scaffolding protein [Dichelobacter nodosus]
MATEGFTSDGRKIQASLLEQMAKNYDPEKYAARVWLEHFRSIMPNGPFKAYGDVLALKTDKNSDGKTILLAQIEPTDELKKINQQKQKLFSSVEIDPNFAESGEAYLVGLAVTDSPSSLGTERLMFSAALQVQTHLFSAYSESDIDVKDEDKQADEDVGLFAKVKQLLSKHQDKQNDDTATIIASYHQDIEKSFSEVCTAHQTLIKEHQQLKEEFNAFKVQLAAEPQHTQSFSRPVADGSSTDYQTDC